MTRRHVEVLVVGAGPVGLTAAAELRRRGVDVRCVDAAPHHHVSTKALGLQARTLELFERLGVVEAAVARGLPVRRFNILSEQRQIAEFDLGGLDTSYPYLLMLPQNTTEEILRDRMEELGGGVDRGVELIGFTQDLDGVDAVLRHPDRSEHVRADWMIAADGAHSSVRHQLGLAVAVRRVVRVPQPRQLHRVLSDGRWLASGGHRLQHSPGAGKRCDARRSSERHRHLRADWCPRGRDR
jgi:2-polyprenyl-6-methoxyphenol hydroxylase-like FAD-dependent oxidoreductase